MQLEGLYAGKAVLFAENDQTSAISKQSIVQGEVNELGLLADEQANLKVHGGPEQALHQFSASSYQKLQQEYPHFREQLIMGGIGENLFCSEMNEDNVCIGDIYKIGEVKIQVSGPRIPCWKINHKFNTPDIDKYIRKHALSGWYYRVLQSGLLRVHDHISLEQRPNPTITVRLVLNIINRSEQTAAILKQASEAEGLDPKWKKRLA